MEQTPDQHNEAFLHAFQSAMKGIEPMAKDPIALLRMIVGLAPVAVHWMITLHVTLLLLACVAGPNGQSPGLMFVLLLSYGLSIPLWFVKNAVEKYLFNPIGLMILLIGLFMAVYAGRDILSIGVENIFRWTEEALRELRGRSV